MISCDPCGLSGSDLATSEMALCAIAYIDGMTIVSIFFYFFLINQSKEPIGFTNFGNKLLNSSIFSIK